MLKLAKWKTIAIAVIALLVTLAVHLTQTTTFAQTAYFRLEEATVVSINAAYDAGVLSAEKLVQLYINRINAYDEAGPNLNTIIAVNPDALQIARELDEERRTKGPRSLLHGIPVILKDNYDTFDLATTGGSITLEGSIPPDDAFLVKQLRDAGAIIFAKANLSEFALGGGRDGYSSFGGQTLNRPPA